MSFTPITLVGTYTDPGGVAAVGTVSFTLTYEMVQTGVGVVPQVTKTVTLDGSGHFSVSLYANTDALTAPAGVGYNVIESFEGSVERLYFISLPNSPSTIDISTLIPSPVVIINPFAVGSLSFEAAVRLNSPDQLATLRGNLAGGGFRGTGWAAGVYSGDLSTIDQSNGWIQDPTPWVMSTSTKLSYVGADLTALYPAGTKMKWTEGSGATQKYGVVQSSQYAFGDTAIFLMPTTDYVVAANPDQFSVNYSYGGPPDFPSHFNYTPTFTGFSVNPGYLYSWWSVRNGLCYVSFYGLTNGTSSTTGFTISAPIPCSSLTGAALGSGFAVDNGSNCGCQGVMSASGTSITVLRLLAGSATTWTAGSTAKLATFAGSYPI